MNKLIVSGVIILMSLAGVVHAAGDAAAGKNKVAACVGCHGVDGNSMVPMFPKLAGQGEKYIAKQLADFKADSTRKDPQMKGFAAGVSEKDAADIGAFFASQKLKSAAPADGSKLVMGKEIYKGGNLQTGVPACQGGHGPKGAGMAAAGDPQIGGQYAAYTLKQLKAFKDGTRTNDDKKLMRNVLKAMTTKEMEAVAQYIASLN